jgi:OmpA-OmpF porin, OOP family
MQRLVCSLLLFGLAFTAQAQEIRGGYVGLALGAFDFRQNDEAIGLGFSDTTSSYRILGGYQFNSNYAVEAGWGATGDIKESFRVNNPFFGNQSLDISVDYEIATVRGLAIAPFSSVTIFGGVGYYDAKSTLGVRYQDALETLTFSESDSDGGATIIGGVQFELRRIAIRGEYEWFDTDGGVDAYNVGVVVLLRF